MATRRTRLQQRAVPSHRRGSALRVRDLRVRTKLLLVLTIPLLGFLAVTGVQVASSIRTADELDTFSRQVALGREINTLVHELQRERDHTAGVLAALGAPGASPTPSRNLVDLAPDRTAVDRAAAALDAAARPLVEDPTFGQAYESARTALAELPRIRNGAESGWLREPAAFTSYTRVIDSLHALLLVPAAVGGDADLGRAVRAFANASHAKELAAQVRGLLYVVCSEGAFQPGEFEVVTDARAQEQAAAERFRADASASQVAIWDDEVSGQAVRNVTRLEQTVLDNARAVRLDVDAQQWWQASTTRLELMRGAEERLLDAAVAAANARSAEQQTATALGTAGSVLLLLVALLASYGIGRTMIRTLQSLREQALEIAQHRLPQIIAQLRAAPKGAPTIAVDPIAVRSGDEVGEVAEAFTAVHRSAVRLASEQALMRHNVNAIYVNLARRSQTLVERQLQLLDTLESSEAHPELLANLFRLDHLATRKRLNDDNLLVLAGGDATRKWTDPIPLTAVVLAAAAEIEEYTRVRHDITDDVHIVGHVVADLVHLVAELLENATTFSPPQSTVTVLGWAVDNGAALVIQDEGMGMSADAIARANRQVVEPVSIDVAAAERMGLVVVGHLAHRHGIRVELRSSGKGVTVLVVLPVDLLADAPAEPTPWSAGHEWIRVEREALPPSVPRPAPAPSPAPRRGVPIRAEDVLGTGRADAGGLWWSRHGSGSDRAGPAARPEEPAATTTAGLPVRVPMAHLPDPAGTPTRATATEVDPVEAGSMLSRFYGGVHRAEEEEDDGAVARNDDQDLQAVT